MSKPTITNMKVHNNNLVISYTNCSSPPNFVATDEEIQETDNNFSTGYNHDLKLKSKLLSISSKNIFKMNDSSVTKYTDLNSIINNLINPHKDKLNSAFDTYLNWGCKDCNHLNTSVLGPIKDQGHCNSCWDFGTTCILESFITMDQIKNKRNKNYVSLSEQYILNKSVLNQNLGSDGCNEGLYEYAVPLIVQVGDITTHECPYVSGNTGTSSTCPSNSNFIIQPNNNIKGFVIDMWNGFSGNVNVPNENIKQLLQIYGPLVTAVYATNFNHVTSDNKNNIISKHNMSFSENNTPNHQVVLVGYGQTNNQSNNVNYWIIRNSWGETWGKDGYCAIEMAEDASDILAEIGAIQNVTYTESFVDSNTVNQPLS